jgi:hypothetical protein
MRPSGDHTLQLPGKNPQRLQDGRRDLLRVDAVVDHLLLGLWVADEAGDVTKFFSRPTMLGGS